MTNEIIVEMAIAGHASTRDAIRWAMAQEREACADMVFKYIAQTVNMEARGCLASVAYDIRSRGDNK